MKQLFRITSSLLARTKLIAIVLQSVLMPIPIAMAQQTDTIAWPEIPLVTINTANGEMPSCTPLVTPDSCIGNSVTDNKYVDGRAIITLCGDTIYDSGEYDPGKSGMRIKIRGNSSAYFNKYPHYKIKLSKKANIGSGDNKDKSWLLLKSFIGAQHNYSLLSNHLCAAIARYIRGEWQPNYRFVNLVLNDSYRGLYSIADPVNKGKGRVEIDDTGYLIENDPYWWNSDSVFFKTNYQDWRLGWTYKYPEADDVTDSIEANIRDFINECESELMANNDISNYIDIESFASWLLTQDVVGLADGAGSNIYVKKYDFDTSDPYRTKLEMGPLWDFDTAFGSEAWSPHHYLDLMYFVTLLKRSDFVDTYINLWQQKRDGIVEVADSVMNNIKTLEGEAIDQSIELENNMHHTAYLGIDDNIEYIHEWFEYRIMWIDNNIKELYTYSSIRENIQSSTSPMRDKIYDMAGRQIKSAPTKGLYIQNGKKFLVCR